MIPVKNGGLNRPNVKLLVIEEIEKVIMELTYMKTPDEK